MSGLRKTLLTERSHMNRTHSYSVNSYTPVHWSVYFDKKESVHLPYGEFCYYTKGDSGPLLLAIHGGGFSSLTWALFADAVTKKIDCHVVAIDMRGHGNTSTDDDEGLSLETMANDIKQVLESIYKLNIPPTILMGHSMGGAVAVEVARLVPNVVGVCVIDVAEGTAMDSLSLMQSVLRGRPHGFATVEQAIEWDFRGGNTNNIEAARVSMPGQIVNKSTGKLAAEEVCQRSTTPPEPRSAATSQKVAPLPRCSIIPTIPEANVMDECDESLAEETSTVDSLSAKPICHKPPTTFRRPRTPIISETTDETPTQSVSESKPLEKLMNYSWRIDLTRTEKYWPGWFRGLSQKFLEIHQPKLLLMASIHGLDTCLTVGQMQGKFQLRLVPNCGHVIQEDCPEQVAEIVAAYLVKQKLAKAADGFDAFSLTN